MTVPSAGTFVRPLVNGWVAVLTARSYGRDEIELPSWLPGTHGVVTIEARATFPAAERLGARLELTDPSCGFEVARRFAVAGQEPGFRQFRGPEDDERVVAEIVDYARHVLVPAAEFHGGLDAWMAAYGEHGAGESPLHARKIPVMLLAHGREEQAMSYLEAARRSPRLATDDAFGAFADRVEEFVRSGEALPTDGDGLRAVAAARTALVTALTVASGGEGELETAEPEEETETSGWEIVGGLVLIVAVVVFIVGKAAPMVGLDLGWGWLPAAAMVAFGVIKIGEHTEELREKWRRNVGSADRVHEYLERQREEREQRAAPADTASSDAAALDPASPDEEPTEPDDEAPTGPDRPGD